MESEAESADFQPRAWGFLTTKRSQRFANDGALTLREKIAAGMDFRGANRLWADYGRNLSVLPGLRPRTVKTRNSRNGKISTKMHKNTPEGSQFYSFYWMNVKIERFLGFIIDGILFPIQSLITRLNSQRLPVTQHRLHSKVIFPLVINYYTLSSDADLGCLCYDVMCKPLTSMR